MRSPPAVILTLHWHSSSSMLMPIHYGHASYLVDVLYQLHNLWYLGGEWYFKINDFKVAVSSAQSSILYWKLLPCIFALWNLVSHKWPLKSDLEPGLDISNEVTPSGHLIAALALVAVDTDACPVARGHASYLVDVLYQLYNLWYLGGERYFKINDFKVAVSSAQSSI